MSKSESKIVVYSSSCSLYCSEMIFFPKKGANCFFQFCHSGKNPERCLTSMVLRLRELIPHHTDKKWGFNQVICTKMIWMMRSVYCVYVVVNFLFQLIFIFPLFLGMVMYANEFKTKEKQK